MSGTPIFRVTGGDTLAHMLHHGLVATGHAGGPQGRPTIVGYEILAPDPPLPQEADWWAREKHKPYPRFALFWTSADRPDFIPLPAALTAEQIAPLIEGWLGEVDFGSTPDTDGDASRGWLIETDQWGHVAGIGYPACLSVSPHWNVYGK